MHQIAILGAGKGVGVFMQSKGPIINLLGCNFFCISKALCFNEHCSVSVMYMLFIEVSLISN